MAKRFRIYDTDQGRIISNIDRVADAQRLTGTISVGSASVPLTASDTVKLWPGMLLIGKGIPVGTTVLSIDSATGFTMSAVGTATGLTIIVALAYIPYKADNTIDVREVHLEHYRDIFDDTSEIGIRGLGVGEAGDLYAYAARTMKGVLVPGDPVTVGAETGAEIGTQQEVDVYSDDTTFSTSDHVSHTPPREQVQKVSFVHFILDDGTLLPVVRYPHYDIVPVADVVTS